MNQVGGSGGVELVSATALSARSPASCGVAYPAPSSLPTSPPTHRQIPDVDAVLHTADFTCIPRSWEDAGGGAPLPVLGFQVGALRVGWWGEAGVAWWVL